MSRRQGQTTSKQRKQLVLAVRGKVCACAKRTTMTSRCHTNVIFRVVESFSFALILSSRCACLHIFISMIFKVKLVLSISARVDLISAVTFLSRSSYSDLRVKSNEVSILLFCCWLSNLLFVYEFVFCVGNFVVQISINEVCEILNRLSIEF